MATRSQLVCLTIMRSLLVIVLSLFVASLWVSRSVYASSPSVLDGVGSNNCQIAACLYSQSLTTSRGHDVIIVLVESDCCHNISAIIDSSGLTFVPRVSNQSHGCSVFPCLPLLSEYYAMAASPLTSDNISVVTNPNDFPCFCIFGMQVLAIHGANSRSLFDTNSSIPVTSSCWFLDASGIIGYKDPCSATVQTSSMDFVIAITAINNAPGCGLTYPIAVPGFTNLAGTAWFEVDYKITTAPQTSIVFGCNGTDALEILLDAISFHGMFGAQL